VICKPNADWPRRSLQLDVRSEKFLLESCHT